MVDAATASKELRKIYKQSVSWAFITTASFVMLDMVLRINGIKVDWGIENIPILLSLPAFFLCIAATSFVLNIITNELEPIETRYQNKPKIW